MPFSSSSAGLSSRGAISWVLKASVATAAESNPAARGNPMVPPRRSGPERASSGAADEHHAARRGEVAHTGLVNGDEQTELRGALRQLCELEALGLRRAEAHLLDVDPLPERRAPLHVDRPVLERPRGIDPRDEPRADPLQRQLRLDRGLDLRALQVVPLRLV